ncbi:hypothetical protein PBI_SMEAGOL_43 [Mycobacterium phage Smeagol]|nr:hypothetical protein PBI_SMEAGOL_43 [Mycobacterium phage Smeagol]
MSKNAAPERVARLWDGDFNYVATVDFDDWRFVGLTEDGGPPLWLRSYRGDYEGRHRLPEYTGFRELPPGTVFRQSNGKWRRRKAASARYPYTVALSFRTAE